jgi:hypothetical protein
MLGGRDAGVLLPLGTEVVTVSVRGVGPDELRECLGQAPPVLLTLPQGLLGALEPRDVDADAHEAA